jgi:hypothetical protein
MQREEFPLAIRTHPNFDTLARIVEIVNERASAGAHTTLMKVAAHSGNPLNEWANEEAILAFNKVTHVDHRVLHPFECHYLLPQDKGPSHHIPWGIRIRRYAIQRVAELLLEKRIKDGKYSTKGCRSKVEQFLLRDGESRPHLGSWLCNTKDPNKVRSVLMACGDYYPCNAKLFQWKISSSETCSLCHAPRETLCHIQCTCPALEQARIKAHHEIWSSVFTLIQKNLKVECTAVKEAGVHSWHLQQPSPKYQEAAVAQSHMYLNWSESQAISTSL